MAEVKNSSIDLLTRQMPGARKKEEKAVDGFSGFRTMLKSKNQKKDGGNEEAKDSGNIAEGAAAETAAALAAAGTVEAQNPGDMLRLMGQGLVQKLAEGPVTDNVQGVMPDEGEKVQVMDPFQTLNQLRFQNLSEKSGQESVFKEAAATALLPEAEGKTHDTGLADKTGMLIKADHKESTGHKESLDPEILGQTDGSGSDQAGKENILGTMQLKGASEAPVRNEEESVVSVQRGKTEEKPSFTEKDEKKPEKDPGIIRESSYEPNHLLHIKSGKDEAVSTTVNAENLEGLETKLSQQILNQIHAGSKELDIQLEPHNLGKIRIRISYEDSQISVSVLCSESRTLKLLSQSAGELGTILENNLERPIQIFVDKQGADYLNNQKEQGGGQEQHQPQHENRKEESHEDFIQKLRLGIFETGGTEDNETP